MITKEEAEEKLLKIFYDVKLELYYKKNPTKAIISEFEETQDPDDLDYFYRIEGDELNMGIRANSFEQGISYIAVHMARESAKEWREEFLSCHWGSFFILQVGISLIMMITVLILKFFPVIRVGIYINIIGTGVLIYFFVSYFKWRKRVMVRFKEFLNDAGIFLPEVTLKRYSKKAFFDIPITNFSQGFIAVLIILCWVFDLFL